MKYVFLAARILLGLLFGLIGSLPLFMPPPPAGTIPPQAMDFTTLLFATHYVWLTAGAQVISGVLLLVNRYVTFALVVLAAELANIFTFHLTMWPQTLVPMPIVALALWVLTAWPLRERFFSFFGPQ